MDLRNHKALRASRDSTSSWTEKNTTLAKSQRSLMPSSTPSTATLSRSARETRTPVPLAFSRRAKSTESGWRRPTQRANVPRPTATGMGQPEHPKPNGREGHWGVWQLPHVTMGRQPGVAFDDPLPLLPGGQVFHYVGPGRVDAYTRRAAESHRTWLCTTAPFG